jgi:hypothetical protein
VGSLICGLFFLDESSFREDIIRKKVTTQIGRPRALPFDAGMSFPIQSTSA